MEDIQVSRDGWLFLDKPLDWSHDNHYVIAVTCSVHMDHELKLKLMHCYIIYVFLCVCVSRWRPCKMKQ